MASVYYASRNVETGTVWALWRLRDGIYSRVDREAAEWVRDPRGVRATGIGGDVDMDRIGRRQAKGLLRRWNVRLGLDAK